MELMIVLFMIIAFDVLAVLWGVDSTDGLNSREWEARRNWRGFSRT